MDNIVNIGEIDQVLAVAELGQAFLARAFNQPGQQGAVTQTEDRFGAQDHGGQTSLITSIDEILAQLFGGGIGRREVLGVRAAFIDFVVIAPIKNHTGGGDVDQAANPVLQAAVNHGACALDIGLVKIVPPTPRRGKCPDMVNQILAGAGRHHRATVAQIHPQYGRAGSELGVNHGEIAAQEGKLVPLR